jgi:hypothetical protein
MATEWSRARWRRWAYASCTASSASLSPSSPPPRRRAPARLTCGRSLRPAPGCECAPLGTHSQLSVEPEKAAHCECAGDPWSPCLIPCPCGSPASRVLDLTRSRQPRKSRPCLSAGSVRSALRVLLGAPAVHAQLASGLRRARTAPRAIHACSPPYPTLNHTLNPDRARRRPASASSASATSRRPATRRPRRGS